MKWISLLLVFVVYIPGALSEELMQCEKPTIPQELTEKDLKEIFDLKPKMDDGKLQNIFFISHELPETKNGRYPIEGLFGVHFLYGDNLCMGGKEYIYVKKNGEWTLEITLMHLTQQLCDENVKEKLCQ